MSRNCPLIHFKGVIIILVWVFLVNVCDPGLAQSVVNDSQSGSFSTILISSSIGISLYFLLPVVTLIADIKFGGFRFTIISLSVGLLTSGLLITSNLLDVMYGNTSNTIQILLYISYPFNIIFRRAFTVLMVLYGTDLMPDASSEQLSSFIWCHSWSKYMGLLITSVLTCEIREYFSDNEAVGLLFIDGIHVLSLLLIFISCIAFKGTLATNISRKTNPLKLIKDVVLFAKKHPYPLSRWALTFWEESLVSRIDIGKRNYGGPFEEEDVESVKSFFRLLPFLACISLIYFPPVPLGRLKHSDPTTFECLVGSTYFTEYVVVILVISIKLFVLKYSQLCLCGLGMLPRIELGILFILLSKISYTVTNLYVTSFDNSTICFLKRYENVSNVDIAISNDYTSYTLILPQIVGSVGIALSLPTSLEFIFAQCPYSMRGLITGLLFAGYEILANLGWESLYLYSFIPGGMPGCEFFIYITHVLVILVCFLFFSYLKRRYKLRLRNKVFFHYSAAERYYAKLIRNRSDTY